MGKEITITRELVELKHKILAQKIETIYNVLKILSASVNCASQIKSMEVIQKQYEKMYNEVRRTGEYQKYTQIEDVVIKQLARVEFNLDQIVYHTSKTHRNVLDKIIGSIKESTNYKEFHNLDNEIEKVKWIKELFKRYAPYITSEERNKIEEQIANFKFDLLLKRQLEQMVYENGGTKSNLKRYDTEDERAYFEQLLEKIIARLDHDDEIKQNFQARQIMEDNILLNHVVYKIQEQEIEKDAGKYRFLLDIPIFNPHCCNISNDPYKSLIRYAKRKNAEERIIRIGQPDYNYYERKKVNLSLLLAVLKGVIGDKNTTIMECERVYNKFGFKCRPVVVSEGQELIRKVFNKIKPNVRTQVRDTSKTKGQLCIIDLKPYNYDFEPVEEPFLTNAQMLEMLKNQDVEQAVNYFEMIYSLMGKQNLTLKEQESAIKERAYILRKVTGFDNPWVRGTLEDGGFLRSVPVPSRKYYIEKGHSYLHGSLGYEARYQYDTNPLWESYQSDFRSLGICVKKRYPKIKGMGWVCINLDDISELPINFKKANILSKEETERIKKEEGEER